MPGSPFPRHAPASKELMVRMVPLQVMMMMMMMTAVVVMMMMMMMMLRRVRMVVVLEKGLHFWRRRVSLLLLGLWLLQVPCWEVLPLLLFPLLFAPGLLLGLWMTRYHQI